MKRLVAIIMCVVVSISLFGNVNLNAYSSEVILNANNITINVKTILDNTRYRIVTVESEKEIVVSTYNKAQNTVDLKLFEKHNNSSMFGIYNLRETTNLIVEFNFDLNQESDIGFNHKPLDAPILNRESYNSVYYNGYSYNSNYYPATREHEFILEAKYNIRKFISLRNNDSAHRRFREFRDNIKGADYQTTEFFHTNIGIFVQNYGIQRALVEILQSGFSAESTFNLAVALFESVGIQSKFYSAADLIARFSLILAHLYNCRQVVRI